MLIILSWCVFMVVIDLYKIMYIKVLKVYEFLFWFGSNYENGLRKFLE